VLYAHLSKKTFVSAQYERIVYFCGVRCLFCILIVRFFLMGIVGLLVFFDVFFCWCVSFFDGGGVGFICFF